MTNVEQPVTQETVEQLVYLGQCQGTGMHCIDWQSVFIGPPQSPFSERKKVLFMHCERCGLAVRTPQALC
jgi:hypothetical protein